MARAAAIIVQDGQVALIERRNARGVYYLFPGGRIEAGETPAEAAIREAREELGLDIGIDRLIAEVTFQGNLQIHFLASVVGGEFGTGNGEEFAGEVEPESGSYTPIWLQVGVLLTRSVFPAYVAEIVVGAATGNWPSEVHRCVEA